MHAVVTGAVHEDEAEAFVLACAAEADKVLFDVAPDGEHSLLFTWAYCAADRLDTLREHQAASDFEASGTVGSWFERMGAVADRRGGAK